MKEAIDRDLADPADAIASNDDARGISAATNLVGRVLIDLNRSADALERIATALERQGGDAPSATS